MTRIDSIDALRALTMFLMVFVNDLTSSVPKWLRHAEMQEDYLGFSDIIFPAFLFIVGLSIPLAIRNRIKKGDTRTQLIFYILSRAVSLIVMGFFHVNLEHYSEASALSRPIWQILITISFFLIWLDYPRDMSKTKRNMLKGIGVLSLIILALLFHGGMEMHWGGILGLIGWAYLICACVYLAFKDNLVPLAIAWGVFVIMNILAHTGGRSFSFFAIGDGSSVAITMAGVVATVIYSGKRAWWWFFVAGCLIIALGYFIRPYAEGISKIRSTPAWVLICTGVSIAAFAVFIFLVDVKRKKNLFNIIKAAGTSTLTCYLLPYMVYALYSIFHVQFPEYLQHDEGAVIKSLVFSFIIVQVTSILEKQKLRLKV